jgi:hypothetical protein
MNSGPFTFAILNPNATIYLILKASQPVQFSAVQPEYLGFPGRRYLTRFL